MNIHLKILAAIYLFFGYALLLMFVVGHIAFFQYWQDYKSSVMADSGSFYANYSEFFAAYGVFPIKTLLIAAAHLAFGHGLLRRKIWAGHLGFLLAFVTLILYVWDVFQGFAETTYIAGIALSIYTLCILFYNREYFRKPEQQSSAA